MEIGVAVGFRLWLKRRVGCQVDVPRWHRSFSEFFKFELKLWFYLYFCVKHTYHMFKVFLIYVFYYMIN